MLIMKISTFNALREHAEDAYPNECCGALLGTLSELDWKIESVVKASNICTDSAQNRYQIAPFEVVKIERHARQNGLAIAGFYHSHPDCAANWSATDLHEAHWHGCVYIITSVRQHIAADTKAYLLAGSSEENKSFEAVEIKFIPE